MTTNISLNTELSPTYPWRVRRASVTIANTFIVLVPMSVYAAFFFLTDLPGAIIFVAIFLPVQITAAVLITLLALGKRRIGDAVLSILAVTAFSLVLALLGSVLFSVAARGLPAMKFSFFTQNNVYISPTTDLTYGGVGHALLGTLTVVFIASLVAVPLGISTAIYITDMKGRLGSFVRFVVQAMSGVPSIVAGLFIFAAFIVTDLAGFSATVGGIAYAILMLPTVARTAEEVLKLVPYELRDAATALGSSRARVIMKIVLPTAKAGIITAVILGVARVIGETAPLLFTTSNTNGTNLNPFEGPIATIPIYIFQFLASGYKTSIERAWGAALVLMLAVSILFVLARLFAPKRKVN
jgi:phosphate transport system permease protein